MIFSATMSSPAIKPPSLPREPGERGAANTTAGIRPADVFGFLIAQIVGATAAIAYLRLVGARPSFIRHAHDFIPQKSGFSAVGMCVLSPPKLYGLSAQTYSTHGLFARRNVPAADHAMVRTLGSSTVNWSCNALPR